MLDFLREKFRHIHQINVTWINHLNQDAFDLPKDLKQHASVLINTRHIWWSRLQQVEPESELEDELPMNYWLQLEVDNFKKWDDFFEQIALGNWEAKHPNETHALEGELKDWLFLVLQENAKCIGKLELLCKHSNLPFPNDQFIPLIGDL